MSSGFCVRCKKKVEIKGAKQVKMRNGSMALSGACPKCGTKVFRIGG